MVNQTENYQSNNSNKIEDPSNSIGNTMPGSVYASNVHPQNIEALIRDFISDKERMQKPEYIATELPRDKESAKEYTIGKAEGKFYENNGQDIGKPSYEYIRLVGNSVHDHPERTIEQHLSSLRPTAEEQRHWGPLAKIPMPDHEVERYTWKAETGTIQTYKHVETGKHIHIDGNTDQFYDQKRNPITEQEAFQHATAASPSHRLNAQQQVEGYGIGR